MGLENGGLVVLPGAAAGEVFAGPEALQLRGFPAIVAGLVAADGALRIGAGVGMDEDVSLAAKVITQDFFQFFNFVMAGLQAQVPGQDEVKIHKDVPAGAARPELVDVDPHLPAMPGDNFADLLQKFGV